MDDYLDDSEDIEVIYLEDAEDAEDAGDTAYNTMDEEPDDVNLDVIDTSKITFSKHMKSVFCGDISKDSCLAATGGEDDNAYVWSTEDATVKFECSGHKDSITYSCFNHDNQLLATGDMGGMIQVWNIKDNKLIWCYEGDDMEWLMWHPLTNVLISGSQSGDVFVWQVPQGNCKILPSNGFSCTCGKILPDGKNLLAGYRDGQVKLWDIKTITTKWSFLDSNKANVTSIEVNSDGTLCSVAPGSHLIKVADGKSLGALVTDSDSEIETHVFINDLNVLITGSLNGQICVWDLQRNAIRHQAKLDVGVTVLKLGFNGKVFVGCTGGAVHVCDVRTGALVETLTGHRADVLSLCVSPDGRFILTTSDDTTAKIFAIQN